MVRIALYTATTGQYEDPIDGLPPATVNKLPDDIDCYRFSDSPNAQNHRCDSRWKFVRETARLPGDSIRSARAIKILGHPVLASYDVTVWIDNRVRLKVPVDELVGRFLPRDADIALPVHSYHNLLADEFDAVLDGRFDDPRRVRDQRAAYAQVIPNLSAGPVYWTAILIRRNNSSVRNFNTIWWEQVLRHSRRDQLSFPYACHVLPELRLAPFAVDNFGSDFHEWRKMSDVGRQSGAGHWSPESLPAELADTGKFLKDRLKRSTMRLECAMKKWGGGAS